MGLFMSPFSFGLDHSAGQAQSLILGLPICKDAVDLIFFGI
jgi:hypothetical protein